MDFIFLFYNVVYISVSHV